MTTIVLVCSKPKTMHYMEQVCLFEMSCAFLDVAVPLLDCIGGSEVLAVVLFLQHAPETSPLLHKQV